MGTVDKLRSHSIVLTVAFLGAFCASIAAQTASVHAPREAKEREVPADARAMPFSPGDSDAGHGNSIEFRSADRMTEKDRDLAANAESSIGESAGYAGLEFNQGTWSYEQVVCAALPNHIFLRFKRNNGSRDVSIFTVSIPRGEEGRVRIIPIQRRGYSLFSPAPINALTVSAFNHIRAEENPDRAAVSDWLGTGLCYAALAGGHPRVAVPTDHPEKEKFPVASTASLSIANGGGAVVSFSDVEANPRPIEWTMTFNGQGRLLKAAQSPAPLVSGIMYLHVGSGDQPSKHQPIKEPAPVIRPAALAPSAVVVHPVAPPTTLQSPVPTSATGPN